jgi:hypothetical protein
VDEEHGEFMLGARNARLQCRATYLKTFGTTDTGLPPTTIAATLWAG